MSGNLQSIVPPVYDDTTASSGLYGHWIHLMNIQDKEAQIQNKVNVYLSVYKYTYICVYM